MVSIASFLGLLNEAARGYDHHIRFLLMPAPFVPAFLESPMRASDRQVLGAPEADIEKWLYSLISCCPC